MPPLLEIDFHQTGPSVRMGDPLVIELKLTNLQPDKDIPQGLKIAFPANDYFQHKVVMTKEVISRDGSISMTAEFRTQASATDESFHGKLEYVVTIGAITQRGSVILPTGVLRADFLESKWGPINLMVVGSKGAGKSALLNAITTCLSSRTTPIQVALAAPKQEHVTTEFVRISIAERLQETDCNEVVPLFLFDTWGDSEEDYGNDPKAQRSINYQPFLKGMIDVGVERAAVLKDGFKQVKMIPRRENEVHAVCVVTPITSYVESGTIERLNSAMKQARELGYRPIVVVTFDDTIEQHEEKEKHRKELLSKLEVDRMDIFFHSNYYKDRNRNVTIDLSTRLILRAVWDRAEQFKLSKGEEHWKGIAYEHTSKIGPLVKIDLSRPQKGHAHSRPPAT